MENKIICGDIFEVLQKFPDNTVDYTITSPPYNVGWNNMHGEDYTRYDEVKDKMTAEQYGVWQDKVMAELLRVTKKHIFYNIQMLSNNKLAVIALLANYRHKFKDVLVWKKNNFPPAIEPGVMSTAFEFIFVFSNEAPDKRKFYDANFHANFSNVIQGNSASAENKFADIHKATFPLYIPGTLIEKFTQEGEIILDPFIGTGTTVVAAQIMNRKYIGIDISEQYCELTRQRLQQKSLF